MMLLASLQMLGSSVSNKEKNQFTLNLFWVILLCVVNKPCTLYMYTQLTLAIASREIVPVAGFQIAFFHNFGEGKYYMGAKIRINVFRNELPETLPVLGGRAVVAKYLPVAYNIQ